MEKREGSGAPNLLPPTLVRGFKSRILKPQWCGCALPPPPPTTASHQACIISFASAGGISPPDSPIHTRARQAKPEYDKPRRVLGHTQETSAQGGAQLTADLLVKLGIGRHPKQQDHSQHTSIFPHKPRKLF